MAHRAAPLTAAPLVAARTLRRSTGRFLRRASSASAGSEAALSRTSPELDALARCTVVSTETGGSLSVRASIRGLRLRLRLRQRLRLRLRQRLRLRLRRSQACCLSLTPGSVWSLVAPLSQAASLVLPSQKTLLCFLTQAGDFDSWEFAQKLVDLLPAARAAGLEVACVVIGSLDAARAFAGFTNLPRSCLYADPDACCYSALGFEPGAGRGAEAQWLSGAPGMMKLMAMCAGIGSPGTLQEVLRGYRGDANAPPVFNEGSNIDVPFRSAFDLVGVGCQRPFELATLRGRNMLTILQHWEALAPADDNLLVQRGGVLLFDGGAVNWRHNDAGILGFVDPKTALRAAGVEAP